MITLELQKWMAYQDGKLISQYKFVELVNTAWNYEMQWDNDGNGYCRFWFR